MIPRNLLIHLYGDKQSKEKLLKSRKNKFLLLSVLSAGFIGYKMGSLISEKYYYFLHIDQNSILIIISIKK